MSELMERGVLGQLPSGDKNCFLGRLFDLQFGLSIGTVFGARDFHFARVVDGTRNTALWQKLIAFSYQTSNVMLNHFSSHTLAVVDFVLCESALCFCMELCIC